MQKANRASSKIVVGNTASLLRTHGLKATPQRVALLRVLASEHKPLALHDVAERMEKGVANQSTLYRAMHDLTEAGLVRSVDFRHSHAHYELKTDREHHHLICTGCGEVEEYVSPMCAKIEADALQKSRGFASISDHSFELYGTCKLCATQ